MTKSTTLILLFIFCLGNVISQTSGELTVQTTTSSAGGNYVPKNIVAIWIEDDAGNFVKTLLAYAQNRKTHLNIWEASTSAAGSIYNTVDAITGPTQTNHAIRTCYWNGTNIMDLEVPDGQYTIRMELTDKNSTGNYSSFNFTKGPEQQTITPFNVPSFGSISIIWDPIPTNVDDWFDIRSMMLYPNPTVGVFKIDHNEECSIVVFDIHGNAIYSGNNSTIDISDKPVGIYFVKIRTESGTITKRVVLQ